MKNSNFRKVICFIIAGVLLVSGALVNAGAKTILRGDVDLNGSANILDIVLINRMLVEWSGYENYGLSSVADVNRDGVVNVLDSTILARHLAGWSDYAVLPLN